MIVEDMPIVEAKIGYEFKEKSLLGQAFVRKSFGVEHDVPHNEILEFVGDKVLDIAVIRLLINEHCSMTVDWKYQEQLKYQPVRKFNEPNVLHANKDEGELTEIKKALVQRKNLARRIDELDLVKYIILNQSDIDNSVAEKDSVKEDLFEAILGAVALDCNWDMEVLTRVVDQMLQPDLSETDVNYVSNLQEWSQKKYGVLPLYTVKTYNTSYWHMSGYIYDSNRNFKMSTNPGYIAYLKIEGIPEIVLGFGSTQSEARQDAARYALKVLEDRDLLFSMKDEIEDPSRDMAINQLEILSRRGYFVLPEYSFEETYDGDGNPVWSCTVSIPETSVEFSAECSSKKDSKKDAAYKLLVHLLDL